ncbi:MAG: DsbA family protein [Comamonas sp.]|uniref:DsbA family protein n=1 Tax=Comamonas sp. TaxID=34028 RepID=UPI002FCB73A3
MNITYLLDPLCGWCYGASPLLQQLGQLPGMQLELAPTGLFAGAGARTLDAEFAQYAWANDMRIQKLTGQRFSEKYRSELLGKLGSRFDSTATTLARTAVLRNAPQRELEALKVLQEARYVHALDTGDMAVVAQLLREMQLDAAADLLLADDAQLLAANAARLVKAQGLKQAFGAQGVPALIVKGSRLLRGDALYGSFDSLLAEIAAA